jgi:hypothetical protein
VKEGEGKKEDGSEEKDSSAAEIVGVQAVVADRAGVGRMICVEMQLL